MGKVRYFSDEEITFLKLHKYDMTDAEIATYLGRDCGTIKQKRLKLGIDKLNFVWNKEKVNFLVENFPYISTDCIAGVLGISEKTVREKAKKLGLKKSKIYSTEEDEFIRRNYYEMSASKLALILNATFHNNYPIRTNESVYQRATMTLGMERKPYTHNIGEEVFYKSRGHVYVKVDDVAYAGRKNYKRKSNIEYENKCGEIEDGFKIIHLDGNPYNFELDNMALVNNSIIGTCAGTLKGIRSAEKDVKKVVWRISQLEYEIRKEKEIDAIED